jgi:hypothetical protein
VKLAVVDRNMRRVDHITAAPRLNIGMRW